MKEELIAAFAELVDSAAFTNGPAVNEFERAFADYCGAAHCVGVASGLDALRLGLLAAGIERGDEVAVPAHTFVATLEAVTQAGGKPVPVDISDEDYCIDADAVSATSARSVMPVYLYGQIADLAPLERLGRAIVEDACQAHGAVRQGRRAGASGHIAAFSFYPGKNLRARAAKPSDSNAPIPAKIPSAFQ
ncbi:MAG TPA: aminotransferase class I/II-fold pyridoxal phosphate-dependent enzyme [Gaiellaceae bacterium]